MKGKTRFESHASSVKHETSLVSVLVAASCSGINQATVKGTYIEVKVV